MGRPLSRQQFFGANSKHNIKVHFFNGTEGVQGYILKQHSTKHFLCEDVNGNKRLCKLVDKVSADLSAGEMSIAFVFDDGAKGHAIKIARHRITVFYNGQYRSMPWTFDANNSDGRWQIDEAGTNTSMDGATDVGGEDFNFLTQYPAPYSGDYQTALTAMASITWSENGTPFEPGGSQPGLGSLSNYMGGLRREKYLGNFTTSGTTLPSAWNDTWFNTATIIPGSEIFDPAMSFGAQNDNTTLGPSGGGENFSLQWFGWVKVPASRKYNFYLTSDDHFGMWIGDAALGTPTNSNRLVASNAAGLSGLRTHTNSLILDANKYYPVRFWFSEHNGSCKAQVFAIDENGTKYNGDNLTWLHNSQGLY